MSRSLHTVCLITSGDGEWMETEHDIHYLPRDLTKASMQIQHAEMCLKLGSLEPTLHFPRLHSRTVRPADGHHHHQIPSEKTILNFSCTLEDSEDWGKDIGANMRLH